MWQESTAKAVNNRSYAGGKGIREGIGARVTSVREDLDT